MAYRCWESVFLEVCDAASRLAWHSLNILSLTAGTASMRAALEILGYRCYHMFEVFENAQRSRDWQKIYTDIENGRKPDFDHVFQGYGAAVDAPVEAVWRDVVKAHPDIKVCLPQSCLCTR